MAWRAPGFTFDSSAPPVRRSKGGPARANAATLAAFLDHYPVDLVNSQSAKDRTALTWLALTRRLRVPLVVTRRQMPRSPFLKDWLVSRLATRVVAVSRAVGDALVRRGTPRDKLAVIPNGLVTERVDGPIRPALVEEWRRRIEWEPSRRTIGIVSRPKPGDSAPGPRRGDRS